ncbi:hypothetical protein L2735_14410 [Shewanella olleyana]|uniref:hypothetical protein n=1 Tax=Shewanella TaxID=22 RepID=UPI00129D52B1|nr:MULTISPECIES: hypothetical protein [Shewanella]MCL1067984.1 hypothetical protein [Shewanella olleyana]
MRGWILIALIGGVIYYFATETDKLDEPIAEIQSVLNSADEKVTSMTGTKIIRKSDKVISMPSGVIERLSSKEALEFKSIFTDNATVAAFDDEYCGFGAKHPVFGKENLQLICDKI